MDLTAKLLRQIDAPSLSRVELAQLRCQLAKELEESGNYEAAREAMGDFWRRIGERPSLDGLDERTSAEVLLRAGSLTGWIGSSSNVEGAQELAKDLISESASWYYSLQDTEKSEEAYIFIAIFYWR